MGAGHHGGSQTVGSLGKAKVVGLLGGYWGGHWGGEGWEGGGVGVTMCRRRRRKEGLHLFHRPPTNQLTNQPINKFGSISFASLVFFTSFSSSSPSNLLHVSSWSKLLFSDFLNINSQFYLPSSFIQTVAVETLFGSRQSLKPSGGNISALCDIIKGCRSSMWRNSKIPVGLKNQ